ncbi:hypothetical protein OROHE_000562 [Orobanche hederae]
MEFAQGGFKFGSEPARGMTFSSTSFSIFQMGFLKRMSRRRKTNQKIEKPALLFVKNKNRRHRRRTLLSLPETSLGRSEKANSAAFREGLESLEWLSLIVDDSFPDYSFAGKFPPQATGNRAVPAAAAQEKLCFPTPVQTKARTKRVRAGVRVRPVLSPSSVEPSSSSSTSTTTSFSPPNGKRKKLVDGGGAVAAPPRRCAHCGIKKTPQWRAGPLGPKTLCNACGVRHKSGRLLPEYRPACSPTFSTELHSNNHRKVLEMRRKKEVETEAAGPPLPVRSF